MSRAGALASLRPPRERRLGWVLVASVGAVAVLAPLLSPHDPFLVHMAARLKAPSLTYPLGTDSLGRCLLSRLIWASRSTLGTTLAIVAIAFSGGFAIGLGAGLVGRAGDGVIMRLVDLVLGFPKLLLALGLVAAVGPGLTGVVIALSVAHGVIMARLVRNLMVQARLEDYVEAAVAAGLSDLSIMRRHVLPNIVSPMLVFLSLEVGVVSLELSGLSFLGLGVQPPTVDWGGLMAEGRAFAVRQPLQMIAPGLMLFLFVLGANLAGDRRGASS